MATVLRLACSPCPNDSHLIGAVASGAVRGGGFDLRIHRHDIETLNRAARDGRYDIVKVSCHTWLAIRGRYRLLPVGATIGRGNGPLLLARPGLEPGRTVRGRVALPGEGTTAHLLFSIYPTGTTACRFLPYDAVIPALAAGECDYGVVIDEARFTYPRHGLRRVADLGAWWEARTGLPLPLGCFVIRRSLADQYLEPVTRLLRESLRLAGTTGGLDGGGKTDPEVAARHISTFVNHHTHDLGGEGRRALALLSRYGRRAGLLT